MTEYCGDPVYPTFIGSSFLSPYYFSLNWGNLSCSIEHTLDLEEEVVVVVEVGEAWEVQMLLPKGVEH